MSRRPQRIVDIEPSDPAISEEGAAPSAPASSKKYEPSWAGVGQLLVDEDLEASAVRKMLVNELSRLTQEVKSLEQYRDQFHEADKKTGVLEERSSHVSDYRRLSALVVSVGSIMSGLGANQIYAGIQPGLGVTSASLLGMVVLVIGLVCVLAPLLSLWAAR